MKINVFPSCRLDVRKSISLALGLIMISGATIKAQTPCTDPVAGGNCGTTVTWSLSCDSVLTISGTGAMASYTDPSGEVPKTPIPWRAHKDRIKRAVINEGVTEIGTYPFFDCNKLVSVSVPSSVAKTSTLSFSRCPALTAIDVAAGNAKFSSVEGVLFNKSGSILHHYPEGKTGDYTILPNVKSLDTYAFIDSKVQTVTIPAGVTTFGDYVFRRANLLDSIKVSWTTPVAIAGKNTFGGVATDKVVLYVPVGTTANYRAAKIWSGFEIAESNEPQICDGSGSFGEGGKLSWELSCSDSVLKITGTGAMSDFSSSPAPWATLADLIKTATIGEGVTNLGYFPFDGCNHLLTVSLSKTVAPFSNLNFLGCQNLQEINVAADNAQQSSDDGVLFNKGKTIIQRYPQGKAGDYSIPSGVLTIFNHSFSECTGLTTVTIPQTVANIGGFAFRNDSNINTIRVAWPTPPVLPDDTSVFYNVKIENIVLSVPKNTKEAYLAASVWNKFTIEERDEEAPCSFEGQWGATADHKWELSCDSVLTISGTGAMPDYTTSQSPAPWRAYARQIKKAIVGEGIFDPGDYPFYGCMVLDSIILPASDSLSNTRTFIGCNNLKGIRVSAGNKWRASEDGILFNKAKTSLMRYPQGKAGNYTVPSTVTRLWNNAFSDCGQLKTVSLPVGLTTFGSYVFEGDTIMMDTLKVEWGKPIPLTAADKVFADFNPSRVVLYVPKGTKAAYEAAPVWKDFKIVESNEANDCPFTGKIGEYITWSLSCDSVLTIVGKGALGSYESTNAPWFPYSDMIKEVRIDEGITGLGGFAFENCNRLRKVYLPKTLLYTGFSNQSLLYCPALEEINVSDGSQNFSTANGVLFTQKKTVLYRVPQAKTGEYVIPSSVTRIFTQAFSECLGLTEVSIPSSVTEINDYSFRNDSTLDTIKVAWDTPLSITDKVFDKVNTKRTVLYVPSGKESVYRADAEWGKFVTIVEAPEPPTPPTEPIHVASVTLSEQTLELIVGDKHPLTPTILPANADNKEVSWISSVQSVASVSSTGEVTALEVGNTSIIVTTDDGAKADTCKVVVTSGSTPPPVYNVISVTLDSSALHLAIDQKKPLHVTILPTNATNSAVTWNSNAPGIAEVSQTGEVTGKAVGTAVITVTSDDGGKTATCTVTVAENNPEPPGDVPVESVSVVRNKIIIVGEEITLTATVSPADATNKAVIWSSADSTIATVDANGVVKGVTVGYTNIIVTSAENSEKYAECELTVNAGTTPPPSIPVTGVTLNTNAISLLVGADSTLIATIAPDDATTKDVRWDSDKPNIADVSQSGKVTAKAAGKAKITVTTNDGNKTAICEVTVTESETEIPLEAITLNVLDTTVIVGATVQLEPIYIPRTASKRDVTWQSYDPNIATVDDNGLVRTIAVGDANITVTSKDDPNIFEVCWIHVELEEGTGIDDEAATRLTAYPNPTTGELRLEADELKAGDIIEVLTTAGQRLAQFTATGTSTVVNLSALPQGTYVIRATRTGLTVKVVKR